MTPPPSRRWAHTLLDHGSTSDMHEFTTRAASPPVAHPLSRARADVPVDGQPAVDDDLLAGDVARRAGGEERHDVGDVLRLPDPVQADPLV